MPSRLGLSWPFVRNALFYWGWKRKGDSNPRPSAWDPFRPVQPPSVSVHSCSPAAGEVEDVTDPEEVKIVLGALHNAPDEPELTSEQAKVYLDERRRRGP